MRPLDPLAPPESPEARTDGVLAYAVLRLTLGINLLLHGLTRFSDLSGFADGIVGQFESTFLPAPLVRAFALALPFVEAATGALLVLGLWTRWVLAVGGLTITALTFGTALQQNWDTLGTQLIYALAYFVLLMYRRFDRLSLDGLRRSRQPSDRA